MALIGYARVSTRDQEPHLRLDAFAKAGASDIRQEKGGSLGSGPGLQKVLASLIAGGVLVVCKMGRVARSLKDLLSILDRIQASGAAIRSLTEPLDTSGPIGTFMVQVLGAVAQLERSIISERALAGQVAAYNRWVRWGGRVPKLSPAEQLGHFRLRASGLTLAALALRFNVADSTISRFLTPPAPSSRRVKLPVLGLLVSPNDWRMIRGKASSIDCSMAFASCCTLSVSSTWSISPSTAARFGSSPAVCVCLIRFSMVHVLVPAFQFGMCGCLSPSISAGVACVPAIAAAFPIVKVGVNKCK